MGTPNIRLYPFADQSVGVDGVIYKAGFRSNTANDEDGLGLGYDGVDWASESGGTFTYDATEGLIKTSDENTFTARVEVDYPAIHRVPRATRGALQVQIKRSDIVVKTLDSKSFLRITSTDGDDVGIQCKTDYYAQGSATGYRQRTDDMNATSQFGSAYSWGGSSTSSDSNHTIPLVVVTSLTEIDNDGFFTFGLSWTGAYVDWYINGVHLCRQWRGGSAGPALQPSDLLQLQLQVQIAAHQRDLILWDRPFQEINIGPTQVLGMGHSFLARNAHVYEDRLGASFTDLASAMVEGFTSQLYKDLSFGVQVNNWPESGSNMIDFYDKLQGDTTSAYNDGTGTAQDYLTRQHPHFCFLWGPMFNGGYTGTAADSTTFADHEEAIHVITDLLMKAGTIPIWVIEYNDNNATSPVPYSASVYAEVIAECNRQQAVNDIGIVDGYVACGGATCSPTYIQDGDSNNVHPNAKATGLFGQLLAAEMNRLYANPPKYSRLAGSAEYVPQPIAAP